MKRSELFAAIAKRFPWLFRWIFTLSIRGYLPPIHNHWLLRDVASDLFSEVGFPMHNSPYRLFIPQNLHSIYFGYFDFLDHEPLTTKVFSSLLKPGAVVVDVGANIGHYTLLAAGAVGPTGRVHAIECSPVTLAVLEGNMRKNHLENVEIHPVAAAGVRGTLELNVTAIGLSWFNPHSQWPTVEGSGTTVKVPAVPLDEIISSPVHLVKIDAEGVDLDVLKGMKRILTDNEKISIIVEWAPPLLVEVGKDPMELPLWLKESGFNKISVLDEIHNKQRSLEEAMEMVRAGNLPRDWVCDLFAQRVPLPN
jgi:FkbM family methyltransferase